MKSLVAVFCSNATGRIQQGGAGRSIVLLLDELAPHSALTAPEFALDARSFPRLELVILANSTGERIVFVAIGRPDNALHGSRYTIGLPRLDPSVTRPERCQARNGF
jgi:hypothetical protein